MTEHQVEDPAGEAVRKATRGVLMAAGVAAEMITRYWRQEKERAARATAEDARQLHSAYTSHRRLADLQLAGLLLRASPFTTAAT